MKIKIRLKLVNPEISSIPPLLTLSAQFGILMYQLWQGGVLKKTCGNQLSKLVAMDNPSAVLREVEHIAHMMHPGLDFNPVGAVFNDILKLFGGDYPGYRKCNTEYHDLKHTTDTFLAVARLMHGAFIHGHAFRERTVVLGLISALMHDTGYIQTVDDDAGTGAKYTLQHIGRSISFMEDYFRGRDYYSGEDFDRCGKMLNCTGFATNVGSIDFESDEVEVMGKILGTADLLGQMSDRKYLEKLLFLYSEFVEGNVPGFVDEYDLLSKTINFYDLTRKRFDDELGGVHRHMVHHFRARWGIDHDLYADAVEKNIAYLRDIVGKHKKGYRAYFRRDGAVQQKAGRRFTQISTD